LPKALLDSATYIDLEKANKYREQDWAVYSLRQNLSYRTEFGLPFLSSVSIAEIARGLYRDVSPKRAVTFREEVLATFVVLDLDRDMGFLAGEIASQLDNLGIKIGIADCFLAATAIRAKLSLVTSNTRHFQRIVDLGYPLELVDWRIPDSEEPG